jgi:hypothetical protein
MNEETLNGIPLHVYVSIYNLFLNPVSTVNGTSTDVTMKCEVLNFNRARVSGFSNIFVVSGAHVEF